jgi:hypothetical protein
VGVVSDPRGDERAGCVAGRRDTELPVRRRASARRSKPNVATSERGDSCLPLPQRHRRYSADKAPDTADFRVRAEHRLAHPDRCRARSRPQRGQRRPTAKGAHRSETVGEREVAPDGARGDACVRDGDVQLSSGTPLRRRCSGRGACKSEDTNEHRGRGGSHAVHRTANGNKPLAWASIRPALPPWDLETPCEVMWTVHSSRLGRDRAMVRTVRGEAEIDARAQFSQSLARDLHRRRVGARSPLPQKPYSPPCPESSYANVLAQPPSRNGCTFTHTRPCHSFNSSVPARAGIPRCQ